MIVALALAIAVPIPPPVAAAARAIARWGARPTRLTTPMRGVRRERFARGWVWIVDSGRMDDSSLCGTGGCVVQLWVPMPGGRVARRFDQRVRDIAIERRASPSPLLRVDFHGSRCGGLGNEDCPMAYRWHPGAPGRFRIERSGSRAAIPPLPAPARVPE